MAENVTQIKSRITLNVDMNAKIRGNIICREKIISGILVLMHMKIVIHIVNIYT